METLVTSFQSEKGLGETRVVTEDFKVFFRLKWRYEFCYQSTNTNAIIYLFYKVTLVLFDFLWCCPCLCTLKQNENDVSVSQNSEREYHTSNQDVRGTRVILYIWIYNLWINFNPFTIGTLPLTSKIICLKRGENNTSLITWERVEVSSLELHNT